MDLTTRCPQCGTLFSASLEQLQLRKGYIRCINCAHIFDGYEAVVSPSAGAPTTSPPTTGVPAAGVPAAGVPAAGVPAAGVPAAGVPADAPKLATRSIAPVVPPGVAGAANSPAAAQAHGPFVVSVQARTPAPAPAAPSVLRQRAPGQDNFQALAVSAEAAGPRHTIPDEPPRDPAVSGQPFTISGELPASPGRESPGRASPGRASPGRASPVRGRPDPVFRVGGIVEATSKPEPVIGGSAFDVSDPEPQVAMPPQRAAATATPSQIYVEPRDDAKRPGNPVGPAFMDRDATRSRAWAHVVWSVLVAAGIVLLMAQAAYVYRAQLANQIPLLRPMLERGCSYLKCSVPYARRIDLISIMSSSLRAGNTTPAPVAKEAAAPKAAGSHSETMMLQVTLRNTYDRPQEWPTLVLDLTDFSGTLVARKNLPPAAYLQPDVAQRPFPAGSEVTVSLPIVLNDLKINGYQLSKFFQ